MYYHPDQLHYNLMMNQNLDNIHITGDYIGALALEN